MTLKEKLAGRLPLAFGVSGPLATGLTSARQVTRLIEAARRGGISLFDTAPAYGAGEGERRLGAALAADADVLVMTKAGLTASGLMRRRRAFGADAIERSVEASLERLGRPVDVLWLHGAAPEELTAALLTRLAALTGDGRIAHLGLAGRGPELEAGLAWEGFEGVMLPLHAGLGEAARARVGALKARGLAVFGIETMAPAIMRRRGLSAGAVWRLGRRLMRGGRDSGEGTAMDPDAALNWSLTTGGADIAVITTSRLDRLRANLATAGRLAENH